MSSFQRNPRDAGRNSRDAGPPGGTRPPDSSIPDFDLDQPSADLFDKVAEGIATGFVLARVDNKTNKTSQIRRFYDEVIRFADRHPGTAGADQESFLRDLPFIRMICARAAYAKSRGLVDGSFVEFMQKGIRAISSPRELANFRALFEAVIAFSPKD